MKMTTPIFLTMCMVISSHADVVFGPTARTQFDAFRDNDGDRFEDFESLPTGPLTGLDGQGVTFRTTENRFGTISPLDLPVVVLPWDFVTTNPGMISPIRSGAPRYIPDGQNLFEIRFDQPQLRVGIRRIWNSNTITRFYNGDTLLAEHDATANNEFVGYLGAPDDSDDRVTKIELDGERVQGVYQVGFADDLFWHGGPPAPPSPKPCDPAIRLTFDQGNEFLPVWDPNGEIIAFSTDRSPGDWRDIGGVHPDGTGEGLLATGLQSAFGLGPGPFSWVGSTGRLVTNETISLHEYLEFDVSQAPFTRNAANGSDAAFTPVLAIDGGGGGGFFKVSRDGSTAVWRYSASGGGGRTTIRTMPYSSLTGQNASTIGTIHLDETPPGGAQWFLQGLAISSDGSFFIVAREVGTGYDLWRYETDQSTPPVQLTTSGSSGVFNRLCEISPDDQTIAYTYFSGVTGETNDIFLMNVDGTNVRNLTNTPNISEANPTWSPDGNWLAYQRSEPDDSPFLVEGETPNSNIFKRPIDPASLLTEQALSGAPAATTVMLDGGEERFGIRYRRQAGGAATADQTYISADFVYTIQVSNDLIKWDPVGSTLSYLDIVDHGDGTESVTAILAEPFSDTPRFLRVGLGFNCE